MSISPKLLEFQKRSQMRDFYSGKMRFARRCQSVPMKSISRSKTRCRRLVNEIGYKRKILSSILFIAVTTAFPISGIPRIAKSLTALPMTEPTTFQHRISQCRDHTHTLHSSRDDYDCDRVNPAVKEEGNDLKNGSLFEPLLDGISTIERYISDTYKKIPPMPVEDLNVLYYDIFLLLNLSISISFLVIHRMSFFYLGSAFNEGCLFCILWMMSGLFHGAFLNSAVDGHYASTDERGGPKAAAILALNTFVNAVNLRLIFAFIVALLQHRQVGIDPGEQLIPLEIGFGLALMSCWRALHSSFTPRI